MSTMQSTLTPLENLPARCALPEPAQDERARLIEVRQRITQLTSGEVSPSSAVELASLRRQAARLQADIKTARVRWLQRRHADALITAAIAAQHAAICAGELQRLTGRA